MGDAGQHQASAREARVRTLLFIVAVLIIPLGYAFFPNIFNDGDTGWHIASGRWILQHRAIPATDPFSFTAYGQPWVAMEWPADIVFALAQRAAGLAGLAAVFAAALMALHGIIFAHLQRRAAPLAIVGALLLMDVALSPFMLVRPHVLVWPLLVAWTALLARGAESGRPPPLWAALILTVWSNTHGSFPLAALIGGTLAFDAMMTAKWAWATLRQWLLFGAVSLAAICLNANGLDGLLQPFHIAGLEMLHHIQEWQPSTPAMTPLFYGVLGVLFGTLLWRGVRVPPGRLVLLLLMLFMAFSQQRHQSWFVIVAAVLVPPLFASRAEPLRRLAPLALAAVPLLLARALIPLAPPENVTNPTALLAHVPPELRSQPVFNEYSFGGPLILAGMRPFMDGRSDMYGDALFSEYFAIAQGDWPRFERAVKRYGIRWTILPAGDTKLLRELDKSGEWKRAYADKVGVIHVRREAPSASAAPPGTGAASRPAAPPAPPRA
jgi:hypothetical protein